MRKRFLSVVFALGIVGGIALPTVAESRLFPAMGISQAAADPIYVNVSGDTMTGSLAVDGDVTLGDDVGDTVTVNAGTFTFINPLTYNYNAATTFDGTGFIMTMTATSWDFRGSSFAPFIINATNDAEAVNRITGDGRWGQLAVANTFIGANTFNGNTVLGDDVGDTVTYNAGTHTYSNPSTINYNGATLFDGSGFTIDMRADIWSFLTTTTGVLVPNPACGQCALNSQTGDARYFAKASSLKSGTVAGASFAGNPKIFTVTFGTTFPDTNYSVSVISEEGRTWTFQSKLAGSFVMNSNANLALTLNVDWTAIAHNDP